MDHTELKQFKTEAHNAIERNHDALRALSRLIHSNPECAMNERHAVACLTQELEKRDFAIESGICDMPTAFKASYGSGNPVIAFIAEYDALPDIGHACGHNLIATAAVAAAIGSKEAVDKMGGSIQVIGTPAEEVHGGKIMMIEHGAFSGIDIAMMMHPSTCNSATTTALSCVALDIEFFGKEAHAATHPELGINALDAMILSFNCINSLRQHLRSDMRVHGIITDGGSAANVIPAHSAGRFLVRAGNVAHMDTLRGRVLDCFKAGAAAAGARLEYRWNEQGHFAPMLNNMTMAQLYTHNMAQLGIHIPVTEPKQSFGSTDMGNVSQIVPSMHALVAIAPASESEHTHSFARYAASDNSLTQSINAAVAMAMTAIDILASPDILCAIKQEFSTKH
ncbi:MAG: M20 family metallopeptidase [Dehalococcoidia bacterium]|nr:M20 family metallopeptidase [Dehalococcoidia bacterium]